MEGKICKEALDLFVSLRLDDIPFQYIVGDQPFRYLNLKITPEVFIPRPETELLVDQAIELVKDLTGQITIVDMGTGSGALALSLAREIPQGCIYALDISPEALKVARENAFLYHLESRVTFIQSNLFENLDPELKGKIDMIVSNPPYIPSFSLSSLSREVQKEPHIALDGGSDGLKFYREIIALAPQYLKSGGCIIFEVGMGQAQAVVEMMEKLGNFMEIEVFKDYAGIERIVTGKKMTND